MLKRNLGLLRIDNALINVRYKQPPHHWSVIRKTEQPTQKALNHFDDFYKQVYNTKWDSIRKALLGEKKYVAVVNNFGDSENVILNLERLGALNVKKLFDIGKQKYLDRKELHVENILIPGNFHDTCLENNDKKNQLNEVDLDSKIKGESSRISSTLQQLNSNRLIDLKDSVSTEILQEFIPATRIRGGSESYVTESSHYKLYDVNTQVDVTIVKEEFINFPEHLKIFCFEKQNKSKFESPKRALTGVYNYYLMDGGSILPVLALDVRPGNLILDMCASPGGKSLLSIQTLYPISVVSNDVSQSRLNKVHGAYKQFLFDFEDRWLKPGKIQLTNYDGRFIPEGYYDRILVDAPCSTDRHSLTENDNNIFKASRIKERLQIPVLQRELLVHALKLVKVKGIVVYSTCSLNPIENDGVVHMALKQIWEETNMEFVVKDMSPALSQTRSVFDFYKGSLRYGHLVLPVISQNYGPTYFCKLQKIK